MGALHLSEVTHGWTVPLGTEVFRDNQGERVRGCRLYFIVCDLHTQTILTFYFLCPYYKLFSAPPALPDCCQLWFFCWLWCLCSHGSQSVVSTPATPAAPWNPWEIQILRSQLRPIESETLQLGPSSLVWWAFWVSLMLPKLENHCPRALIHNIGCAVESPGSFKNYWGLCPNRNKPGLLSMTRFTTSALLRCWAESLVVVETYPVLCKMFSGIIGRYRLDAHSLPCPCIWL